MTSTLLTKRRTNIAKNGQSRNQAQNFGIVLQVLYNFSCEDDAKIIISHSHFVINATTAAQDNNVCMITQSCFGT